MGKYPPALPLGISVDKASHSGCLLMTDRCCEHVDTCGPYRSPNSIRIREDACRLCLLVSTPSLHWLTIGRRLKKAAAIASFVFILSLFSSFSGSAGLPLVGLLRFLGRIGAWAGFVNPRQIFVRRCHDGKRPRPLKAGASKAERDRRLFGPSRSVPTEERL